MDYGKRLPAGLSTLVIAIAFEWLCWALSRLPRRHKRKDATGKAAVWWGEA
jgi:hypothetical protein